MRRIVVITALVGVWMGGASAEEDGLVVMSFNIRYGTARDGDNSWPKRKDVVVRTIQRDSPDVVGLQECLIFQADYLVAELPEYRWIGVGREPNGGGEYAAVLYKKKILAPIETGNFWLSETPDVPGTTSWNSACRRIATWAKFHRIEEKQFFYFLNTHFDHRSAEARQASAHLITERVGTLAKDLPVIVTGDFNAKAGQSDPWRIFIEGGLADAWVEAGERVGPSVTWSRFEAPVPATDSRIDWILYGGPLNVRSCETVVFNEDGRYPSDHFPVLARFTLP